VLDVIRPGDARYPGVRHVYTATGSPAAVVRPRSAAEVPEALAFARAQAEVVAIRSGGHGISSISTNVGGVVVDLGALDTVERLDGEHVRIGPGARWGGVARALYPWGLAISSGDSGDVGVGGLATTGGIGLMARAHGLTIDRLTAADVVTADGRTVRTSPTDEPDLFWALRGAGANFGIVTSFEFQAATTPVVVQATVAYALPDPAGFLERWGRTVERAPREVSAFLYVIGGPSPFAQATIVVAGDDTTAAAAALDPFLRLPGVVQQRAQLVPYASVPLTTGAPHTGRQAASAHTGLAVHLDRELAVAVAALLRGGSAEMVQIRSAGGAVNDVPADATAYAHRHQNFSVTAVSTGNRAAFADAWRPLRSLMDGIYLSFESDHQVDDVLRAFPAATLARLRQVKRRWDPDRVFTQNFDIGLDPSAPTAASTRTAPLRG
jgi:FAD/FMN-containing dehydrogenase